MTEGRESWLRSCPPSIRRQPIVHGPLCGPVFRALVALLILLTIFYFCIVWYIDIFVISSTSLNFL